MVDKQQRVEFSGVAWKWLSCMRISWRREPCECAFNLQGPKNEMAPNPPFKVLAVITNDEFQKLSRFGYCHDVRLAPSPNVIPASSYMWINFNIASIETLTRTRGR